MNASPTIAERCVVFLERNRLLNSILIVLYVLVILHGHDFFVQLSIKAMNRVSLPVYNGLVMGGIIGIGLFLLGYTLYSLKRNTTFWKQKLLLLFGCFIYLSIHISVLFEMNIEIIHVMEYIILSFLLFPFTRSIGATLIFALPIMIVDELNQYLVLYPGYNKYFEWSDIVMDIIGSGMLLLLLNIAGLRLRKRDKVFWYRQEFRVLLFLCICMFVGWLTGTLATTTAESKSNTLFVFNRLSQPEQFWQIHAFTGAQYHVLWPWEGTVLIILTYAIFAFYDELVGC